MKIKISFLIIIAILLVSSCVPSLNPLYNEKDLIYNKYLEGTWVETKSKETWTFKRKSDKEYWLNYLENNDEAVFEAHLVKLNDYIFLDIYPSDLKSTNYLYQSHLFPVHTFSKITIMKKQIVIKMLDPAWIEKSIKNKTLTLDYVKSEDESILITAPTDKLQDFALKYAISNEAFKDSLILIRK
ncbi:MAG: hypothetical protein GXO79_09150 [Chlorobi bacterium]|nr:hypothetical protein [Chlorobiota bacterium]